MVAVWSKGARYAVGRNNLYKAPRVPYGVDVEYPEPKQLHAETDLWWNLRSTEVRGGSVYIVGKRSSNDQPMTTTIPCESCCALFFHSQVNHVICSIDKTPRKFSVDRLAKLVRGW